MLPELINHLWQSTLFAAAAALLTVALRSNRAKVRFWLWFSASLKFLLPFALLVSLGTRIDWPPAARNIAPPVVTSAMFQLTQPFPVASLPIAPPQPVRRDWLPTALAAAWACGFAFVALIRFRGWVRIRTAVRRSTRIDLPARIEVRSSPGLLEPGVVGLWRPVLLLPTGIADRLTPSQFEAVLAHELCHVRRRDNLFAAIHMIVEATFWFHPLVWWIGARLIEERERACDEEVLTLGSDPHVYAEAILNVCRLYAESPLVCVSGVTGSNLKKRIEGIMLNRITLKLNFAKKAVLAVAGMAALAVPFAIGVLNAPHARAQSAAATTAKFEAVSIRSCTDGYFPPGGRGKGHPANLQVLPFPPAGRGAVESASPGRLNVNCQNVMSLIRASYVYFGNAQPNVNQTVPIEGAPDWITSDRYNITATTSGAVSQDTMVGPMMQALLEARFGLRIRREVREVPVYALKVAPGGLKLPRFQEGSCTPFDFTKFREAIEKGRYSNQAFEPVFEKPGVNYCVNRGSEKGNNELVEAQGMTLDAFLFVHPPRLDRPIVNQTGLAGLFDFHLEYAPADISTAMEQQLGLTLEPATAPREFLVIDHVEKPSEN